MDALEKVLRWIAVAGVFALPFVVFLVTTSLFFPFITGKNFAFRIIVEIATGSWLALALVSASYRPRRSLVVAAVAIFVAIIAIADAQGVNPFKSFWSNFERMDGWVTLAHLFLYIVLAVSVINTEKLWRRFWQLSIAVSLAVCLYGFLQLAGLRTLGQGGTSGLGARLDATFGNPIYLAAYTLFNIFIAALLWVQERAQRASSDMLPWSIFYGATIVIETVVLFFTGTRGTILGLIGGILIAAILLALSSRESRTMWRASVGVIAAVLVLFAIFMGIRSAGILRNVGFIDRLATISIQDSTIKSRFLNIGMAWEGVKERPILGWGQENYAIVFDKYYDPRMYKQEPWFDRVHNVVMDWLVAGGFLGLLSYLSIFAALLWALWKGSAFSAPERSILTGLLAGYFFHDLFVFDNITSYILFASVTAYIAWRAAEARSSPRLLDTHALGQKALPFVAALALVVVWAGAWYVNAAALAENRMLLQSIAPQSDILTNLEKFEKAISYGATGTQEVREQLAQAASSIAASESIPVATKQRFYDVASRELDLQAQQSPLDARFPLFLGVLFDAYGNYADGAVALQKAHELSPTKQSILYEMAVNAFARGNTADALAHFKLAFELEESNIDARLFYAAAAIRVKQDTLAEQLLGPALVSGEAADARIAAAYASRGQYDKIVNVWKARIAAQPEDVQSYFTLAAAYYAAGNTSAAVRTLEDIAAKAPAAAAEAQTYIEQVKNGTAPKPQ